MLHFIGKVSLFSQSQICHHEDCALLGALIVVLSVCRFYMKFSQVFSWQLFCIYLSFGKQRTTNLFQGIWKKCNKCTNGLRRIKLGGPLYTGYASYQSPQKYTIEVKREKDTDKDRKTEKTSEFSKRSAFLRQFPRNFSHRIVLL